MTEYEELLKLRQLVKKQELELKKRDLEVKKLNTEMTKKDEIIRLQEIRIENMIQAILHANKKLFGPSTETSKHIDGQLSLFDNEEELSKQLINEQENIKVTSYKRKPRKPGVRAKMLEDLPKEVIEYIIDPEETCERCNSNLIHVGKKLVRTDVEFVPAKLIVTQHVRQICKCSKCGTDKSDFISPYFKKAAIPRPLLAHSIATASIVAQVMYQKFMLGVPFSRQEKDWLQIGLVLPRSNMANWVIKCSEEWLTPIYDRIHKELLKCNSLHMDETRIQCNKEPGKNPSSDSFMWIMRSGENEKLKAVYFHYSRTRGGHVAQKLLKGYHNYLNTDAYAGYNKVEEVKRNLCWSHVRRYFIESIPLDSGGKEIEGSAGAVGREYINLLFKAESEMADLNAEEKKTKRQTASRAILDVFWSWVNETSTKVTTNEKLTKALNYSLNQREGLETFLEDGNLPISNNYCETAIRPFATARRAWLFADTPAGEVANGVIYTLVETAKANNLNVYNYLKFLLERMPNTEFNKDSKLIEDYLPWSKNLPDDCRLPEKNKNKA